MNRHLQALEVVLQRHAVESGTISKRESDGRVPQGAIEADGREAEAGNAVDGRSRSSTKSAGGNGVAPPSCRQGHAGARAHVPACQRASRPPPAPRTWGK
jgi:hypothetical protein